jgi:hypothetical protein
MKCIYAFILLSVCLNGCSSDPNKSASRQITFTVIDSLLGEKISDSTLAISFSPPKGWIAIPDSVLQLAIESDISATRPPIRYVYGYSDPQTNSVMTMSRMELFDNTDSSATMKEYKNAIAAGDSSARVELSVFYCNGFKIHQLHVTSSGFTVRKLIYSRDKLPSPIQFDYAIPAEFYEGMIATIESVAGSVHYKP